MRYLLDRLVALDRFDIAYFARNTDPEFQPEGYEIVRVSRSRQRRGINEMASLHRLLSAFSPDVIYQRSGGAYTGAAAWYAQHSGANLVWHIAHDDDVRPGGFVGRSILRPGSWIEKRALHYGIGRAKRIVAQTEQQDALLLRNYGRHSDAIIRNFHPVPDVPDKPDEPFTCMWVANFKPTKRPDALLRLAYGLADQNVRFLVAGRTGGRRYRSLVNELGALSNVNLLGEISYEQVNALLDEAHVLVNTSRTEGFPNTFIQAWFREVPVVSLSVDPDGVLMREKLGMCAEGSEERLSAAVESLCRDAALRARMGRTARNYAAGVHSLDNVDAIVSLLENP